MNRRKPIKRGSGRNTPRVQVSLFEATLFGDDGVLPGQPIAQVAKQASEAEATRRNLYNLDDLRVRVGEGWGRWVTVRQFLEEEGPASIRSRSLAGRVGKLCREIKIDLDDLPREPHERFKEGILCYPLPVLAKAAHQLLAEAAACRLDSAA